MKQNNRTIMKKIFGYITLAMALTACGSDEALQEYEHQQDKYPLQFTATVEDIQTRVTADNNWNDGDEIGIQIGTSEDQQGKYTYATNDGNGTWSSENPVSWKEDQTADVTAWYPYDKKENKDICNQADGYTQYEFLKAEATGQSSQQTVSLVFKHQMAKVMCRVVDAGGSPIRGAKVRFRGYTSVTFDKGEVVFDSGSSGEITPYSIDEGTYTTYVALLAPQIIVGGESFIEVDANGKTYRFKPTDGIQLKAGKSYNYKIKIGNVDYTVDDNGTYHVYTAEGLNKWADAANASPYKASCILENNITLTGENNWTPVCQNNSNGFTGTFDGNEKSISGLDFDISTNLTYTAVGFIGNLGEGGAVKNLTVKDAKMSSTGSSANIGAVAGYNCGTISNCHVINTTISGKYQAGGVVGSNWGTVSYCHVSDDCSVKVESSQYLGGIVGFNASGAITACYALCSLGVTCDARVGGIFGSSTGSCTACYSCCKLLNASSSGAGGISGNAPGTVTACYWANVPGATYEFEKGIGEGTDNTDKVGGTDGKTWADAVTGMNSALPTDAGYKYEIPAGETLPVLVKNQNKGL